MLSVLLVVGALAGFAPPDETARVGRVELFGTGARGVAPLRAALDRFEGTTFALNERGVRSLRRQLSDRVASSTGHAPTDIETVCCDDGGAWTIYVGLADGSATPPLDPRPTGSAALPPALVQAHGALMDALGDAIRAGRPEEEHSSGYALGEDPELRRRQLSFRDQALAAADRLYEVLESSKDDEARAVAAQALGYVGPSERQVEALVRAARDAGEGTRNNAVRALGVLADSPLPLARAIPADPFIALLRSGQWTDRNKGLMVLTALSVPRPPALLERLRGECLADLVEMARWRGRGHADPARVLLGRAAGIPEERLSELVAAGDVEAIVAAAVGSAGR